MTPVEFMMRFVLAGKAPVLAQANLREQVKAAHAAGRSQNRRLMTWRAQHMPLGRHGAAISAQANLREQVKAAHAAGRSQNSCLMRGKKS